ncbi:MAG: AbrB/MazE/SpoVT family DNA-binding domain-containing protein [Candidatus Binatia bacterium]
MLAKKTVKNQITLPKIIVDKLPKTDYFEVSLRGEEIILKPVVIEARGTKLERVRSKMKALGLTEKDVEAAIRWARNR